MGWVLDSCQGKTKRMLVQSYTNYHYSLQWGEGVWFNF